MLIEGYILFGEKVLWLRKSAVKAVLIYAVFAVITLILGVIDNCFGILNTMIGWLFSFRIDFPLDLDNIVGYAASILRTVLNMVLAAMALKQNTIRIAPLDNFIDKHLKAEPE